MALMNVFPESHAKLIQAHEFHGESLLQGAMFSDLLPQHLQHQNYIRYHDAIPRSNMLHAPVHSDHKTGDSNPLPKEAIEGETLQDGCGVLSSGVVQKLEKVLKPQLSKAYRTHVDSTSKSSTSLWDQPSYNIMSAVIGHVLLNKHQKTPTESTKANDLSSGHLFLDVVPGLPNLLSYLQKDDFAVQSSCDSLVFRLVPQVAGHIPPLSPIAAQLPDLFIEFRLDTSPGSERTAMFRRATAIYEQTSADVILPSFVADLRLKSGIIQAKEAEYEDALGPSMQSWIYKTQSAIAQGGRIRAHSPIVKVAIPQFLWHKGEVKDTTMKKEGSRKKMDVTAVPYFFASVEHRQAIPMNFEGYSLVLTSREGGKLAGRGYELKLSTKALWLDGDEAKQKSERAAFYQASYRLARLVDQAARGNLPITRSVAHISKHEQQVTSQALETAKEDDVEKSATQMPSLGADDIAQEEHTQSAVEDVPPDFEHKKQRSLAIGIV